MELFPKDGEPGYSLQYFLPGCKKFYFNAIQSMKNGCNNFYSRSGYFAFSVCWLLTWVQFCGLLIFELPGKTGQITIIQ